MTPASTKRAYDRSPAGKRVRARYMQSAKGRAYYERCKARQRRNYAAKRAKAGEDLRGRERAA
jgi:hypothetical protein